MMTNYRTKNMEPTPFDNPLNHKDTAVLTVPQTDGSVLQWDVELTVTGSDLTTKDFIFTGRNIGRPRVV